MWGRVAETPRLIARVRARWASQGAKLRTGQGHLKLSFYQTCPASLAFPANQNVPRHAYCKSDFSGSQD